jgi:flagellar protein FlaG
MTSSPSPVTAAEGGGVSSDAGTPDVAQGQPAPSRAAVQAAVDHVNAALTEGRRGVEFTIDPDTRAVIVRVIDKQDNTVLRQVPSQEMLAIAKALDQLQGLLLRSRA